MIQSITWWKRAVPTLALTATTFVAERPAAPARALAKEPARMYTNPVYAHDFPDPFVIEYHGRFYAYATESGRTGFQVMDSPDMVHWTHRGIALEVPWSRKHYWA